MIPWYGYRPASSTIYMPWHSFAAATGASSAASNFAAGDIQVYKDGGTTQRSSSAGITVSTSFDSNTGLQMVAIDLSDNTDAGFYAAGHSYSVAVADVTIDSQTVRFWLGSFEIGPAQVDLRQISGSAVDATAAQLGANVVNWKGSAAPAMTGDAYARLGAPAGASVSADIAAVKAVDDAVKAKTDNLPGDPADASDIAASFSSIASTLSTIAGYIDTEVAAIKAKTDNLPSDPADASDVAASFATVTSTLSTISGYIDTEVAAIKAKTDQFTFSVANQVDVNVLDWKGATAPAMTGDAYARLGAPAGASVSADIAAVKAIDDAVKAKTDNLPPDPADASDLAGAFSTVNGTLGTIAGYLDTEVAAIKAKTDNLPAAPAGVGDIPTANANADALLDRTAGVETGRTIRQAMRIVLSALAGLGSGLGTATVKYRDTNDSIDRITATVDASGNRTAITLDAS